MKRFKTWFQSPIHIMMPLVLAVVLVMGTLAYFTDVEAAINTIRFGEVSIETNEELEGITKKNIGVTAHGTSDCFVRIRVDVPTVKYTHVVDGEDVVGQAMITLENGRKLTAEEWLAYGNAPDETIQVTVGDTTYFWQKNPADGFWYLNQAISTDVSIPFINEISYENLYIVREDGSKELADGITEDMLSIPITSEAIQADNIVEDLKNASVSGYPLVVTAFERAAQKNGTSGE